MRTPTPSSGQAGPVPVRRARGFSLISLMVGLALSLLCAVAALHAYRATVLGSRSATLAARSSNVVVSAELQLNKLLPQAGWGIEGPPNTPAGGRVNKDLVLLKDASLSGGRLSGTIAPASAVEQGGNALVWVTALRSAKQCYALFAHADKSLSLLGPQTCDDALSGAAAQWVRSVTMVPAGAASSLQFQVRVTDCWPFGGTLARSHAQVRLTGLPVPMSAICLPNILS